MNKFLLLLFIETALCFNMFAQNNQNKIDSLKLELGRLKICNEFFSKYEDVIVSHKYNGNKAIVELNYDALLADGFAKFCQDYSKVIVDFDRRNLDSYAKTNSPITGNHIIYSTGQRNNKTEINMYYEIVPRRPQVILVVTASSRPQITPVTSVSKRPQVDKIKDTEIENYKKQLQKIRNTKKLYQDLANELQHQVNYNLVETIDNAGDLVLKHVSIPQGDALKAKAMEELRKNAGVENESPIENKVADVVNLIIDDSEKLIELVPGGDKLTNHYLWKLFKSTPEAGKGLGHLAASANIYFRKNEYNNKIQELDNAEQQLIKMIESAPK